jgi:tRNA 2-thiouridine synthesizing protein E
MFKDVSTENMGDMPMGLEINGQVLETDEEGFLLDPSQWNREVAEEIARGESLELDESRWQVVQFVRDYFEERHAVPEARVLLKALGESLGKEKATRKYLYGLFPYGYGQQACKIAGMRKPRKLMLDV